MNCLGFRFAVHSLALIIAPLLTGCGSRQGGASSSGMFSPGAARVSGEVLADGKPIARVVVVFHSKGAPPNFALTDSQGHFEVLDQNGKPALKKGTYELAFQFTDDSRILKKYSRFETCGIQAVIDKTEHSLRFDLETEKGPAQTPPTELKIFGRAGEPLAFPPATSIEESKLPDESQVIGVVVGNSARAYPLSGFFKSELIVDSLGGLPIALTWCSLCESACVWERTVDGIEVELNLAGMLWRNNMVMLSSLVAADGPKSAISYWCQFTGVELKADGSEGTRNLSRVPDCRRCTFASWKEQHPDTSVSNIAVTRRGPEYPRRTEESFMDFPAVRSDARMLSVEQVIGVNLGKLSKAYAIRDLAPRKFVVDRIGTQRIVVYYDEQSSRTSSFLVPDELKDANLELQGNRIQDGAGGAWDVVKGTSLIESSAVHLVPIDSLQTIWAAWADFFAATEIWTP